MVFGERLGFGCYRIVYDYKPDPSCVIKVEADAGDFCNALEWDIWKRVEHTDLAKWFAPCVSISPNGVYMVQKKTKPWSKKLPEKLPNFFTDTKPSNFGEYKGKLAFHDYATNLLMEKGMTKRMKKIDWSWYDG